MEAYLWYLKNVLGVQSILQPLIVADDAAFDGSTEASKKSILIVDTNPWNAAAKELFAKMLAAMKIDESEIQIIFISELTGADLPVKALASHHVICFAEKSAADFAVEAQQFTKTISPSILTQKADLKRQAWEDLKSALAKMGRA